MALDGFSLAENGCVCKIKLFVEWVKTTLKCSNKCLMLYSSMHDNTLNLLRKALCVMPIQDRDNTTDF